MQKQQLTGPEPATSRSIANPLAAKPRLPPASIDPLPSSTSVGVLYPEHPLKLPLQLMINIRFLLLTANGDGLHTMVIPMKDKVVNYTW